MYNETNTSDNQQLSLVTLQDDDFFLRLAFITRIYNWIVLGILCQIVNICGICTNIINVICFCKQGFSDPVNISLLGLAIADLGSLTTVMFTNVCVILELIELDLPFDPLETQYLVSGMPHTTLTRITAMITAVITVERWLCTVMPFQVHQIVTPRKVAVITVTIFIANIVSSSPVYVVNKLGMKYVPYTNKTIVGLLFSHNKGKVEGISYMINNVLFPNCAFLIIICFTIALAINMFKTNKFRMSLASKNIVPDIATIRNQRAAKMVIMISILFIVSFTPLCVTFLFLSLNPQYTIYSKYKDVICLMGGVAVLAESNNSSMNIFIYYRMSSNYKRAFRKLFKKRTVLMFTAHP